MVTITGYGSCYYAFGAMIAPISASSGWSEQSLGYVFSVVLVANGLLAVLGGRLLDRFGIRLGLLIAGVVGPAGIIAASVQRDVVGFGVAFSVGCGVVGALGYYQVTQPAAVRLVPSDPDRAIVRLTIFGVFASPVYLPATAFLVDAFGWRSTLRVEAVVLGVTFLVAAVLLPAGGPDPGSKPRASVRQAVMMAWRTPGVPRWVAASLVGGAGIDALLTWQVPIMTAGGLGLGVAAGVAGLRGLSQILGRLRLGVALKRFGARRTLLAGHALGAAAATLLFVSGHLVLAVIYGVLAGTATGAISSLQGVYTNELVDPSHLGTLFGAQQAVFGVGGAIGPALVGTMLAVTGSHRLLLVPIVVSFLLATVILTEPRHPQPPTSDGQVDAVPADGNSPPSSPPARC